MSTVEPQCYTPDSYQPGMEVVPYFRKVVELRAKYDLYPALAKANIVPDDAKTYALNDVIAAVRSYFDVTVAFSCTSGGAIMEAQMQLAVSGVDNYSPVNNPAKSTCPKRVKLPRK